MTKWNQYEEKRRQMDLPVKESRCKYNLDSKLGEATKEIEVLEKSGDLEESAVSQKISLKTKQKNFWHNMLKTSDLSFIYFGCKEGWFYEYGQDTQKIWRQEKLMKNEITAMAIDSQRATIVVGDRWGYLKHISVETKELELLHEYIGIHMNNICGLAIDKEDEYFYSCSWDGTLKKIDLEEKTVVCEWRNIVKNWCMCLTDDNQYIFVGDNAKKVHQICAKTLTTVKVYEKFIEDIYSINSCFKSEHVILGHYKGYLTEITINEKKVTKHFGKIHTDSIMVIEFTTTGHILTAGYDKTMKQICLYSKKIMKDFGQIHQHDIEAVKCMEYKYSNYIFTTDANGFGQEFIKDANSETYNDTHLIEITDDMLMDKQEIKERTIVKITPYGIKAIV